MRGLSWLRDGARRLMSRYPTDPRVIAVRAECLAQPVPARGDGPLVAAQCVEALFYYALFAALYAELRRQFHARAELVVVRSVNQIGTDWRAAILRSGLVNGLVSARWVRAFRGLIDRVAYRSQSLAHPLGDCIDWFRSIMAWRRQHGAGSAFELDIGRVPVGDLIIDTYLRFRPSPHFDARDRFTLGLIWQAHRDVRRARAYFGRRKPALYLTSYSTYLQHGVAVRVALQEGVRVHSFASFTVFGKQLTASDWFHTADTTLYRQQFAALDRQEERLARAEEQLRVRLAGGVDAATSYMKVSAYAGAAETPPADVNGSVVIFLHDFYDSPHIYPDLVFHDFWSWVGFTIETLRGAGIRFYLKPHPNQILLSNEALRELNAAYPGLLWLSPRITNTQLVEAGLLCGVTMYGTVAHELAYLGVPTIACARHPHVAFEFCRTARTAAEYAAYLRTPTHLPLDRGEMRRQALAFYYMYNLHGSADDLALRAGFVAFWKACHDAAASPGDVVARFRELRELPAFRTFVSGML